MSLCCLRMSVRLWLICSNTSRVSQPQARSNRLAPSHPNTNHIPSLRSSTTSDRSETNFFEGEPLTALSTLSYSENVDLQRSAALAFAEITEKVNSLMPT